MDLFRRDLLELSAQMPIFDSEKHVQMGYFFL